MNVVPCLLLVLLSVSGLNVVLSEDRAPHGLAHENPVAFSPSAYDFFHPNTQHPCGDSSSDCSPLPMAAQVEAADARGSRDSESKSESNGPRVKPGGVAGIVIGVAFAVFLAMGVYYVTVTRRNNMRRAKTVQPDAPRCSESV